jgi:hypothetical protein
LPEERRVIRCINNTLEIHTKIRRKERQGQENDGDRGEDEYGLLFGIGNDGQLILFNRAQLEELQEKVLEARITLLSEAPYRIQRLPQIGYQASAVFTGFLHHMFRKRDSVGSGLPRHSGVCSIFTVTPSLWHLLGVFFQPSEEVEFLREDITDDGQFV